MLKRLITLSALVTLGVFGFTAATIAAKPPSPPGKDPCSHGNTGKECRPDPQPDRGKDCEKHGKEGGVNEDHCKGETAPPTTTTTTETTTTQTTTTDTTTTTTQETTTTTPGTTTGETTTTPAPETTTTSEPVPAASPPKAEPPASGKPTEGPKGEKPPKQPRAGVPGPKGELPFTGLSETLGTLIGLLMLGSGIAIHRRAV